MAAPLDASRVGAILFDLDGTLLALTKAARPATSRLRRFYVLSETPTNYLLAILDRLGFDSWLRPLADAARRAKGIGTQRASTLVAGAAEVVPLLAPHYPLGILTNRSRTQAEGFLAHHALQPHIRALTSRSDLWRFKPHPQAVRHSAARLGVAPGAILVVGDMPVDMETAVRAGAQAVGVLTGFATADELRAAGANVVIPSVAALPPLLGLPTPGAG